VPQNASPDSWIRICRELLAEPPVGQAVAFSFDSTGIEVNVPDRIWFDSRESKMRSTACRVGQFAEQREELALAGVQRCSANHLTRY
jgi:hypothetical protein